MRRFFLGVVVSALVITAGGAAPTLTGSGYEVLRASAEKLVAERSYAMALEAYRRVDQSALDAEAKRWVAFRLADLAWRSAPDSGDDTTRTESRHELETLLKDEKGHEIQDRVSAEANESLGDLLWTGPRSRQWQNAWSYYSAALDWWAGSRDLDLSRKRYLDIVWKASTSGESWNYYGYWGGQIPMAVLENAATIAVSPADRAHARYLLTLQLSGRRDPESIDRARRSFEEALKGVPADPWHEDALFHYGQWLEQAGTLTYQDDGTWRITPDFKKAVEIYERLADEYMDGESKYRDQAITALRVITSPSISVMVSNVFLPGSKPSFQLNTRNVSKVELSLTRIDLTTDIVPKEATSLNWLGQIDVARGHDRFTWSREVSRARYVPGSDRVWIDHELGPGAWVLDAAAGEQKSRELILITDAAIVLRASHSKAQVWATDARTGAPIPGATVSVWREADQGAIQHDEATTDGDGIAEIKLRGEGSHQLFATMKSGQRQAMAMGYTQGRDADRNARWHVFATTDRPAYRPDETAHWKVTARLEGTSGYSVPAGKSLRYELRDPRGSTVSKGTLALNDFGSAWADISLSATMPLGQYNVQFYDGSTFIGSATLFRLEEYKLPEFHVEVKTTDASGKPKAFRTGDEVDVAIEASYYFGGPVPNASVAVLVYQKSYNRQWYPYREYAWYFDSPDRYGYEGDGQLVKSVTIVTDAEGRAHLTFPTPATSGQDLQYKIEARVTDSSRREIVSESRIQVTRAPYFADLRPRHWLARPGEAMTVDFHVSDANDQPVEAEGVLRVTREEWREVWLDPAGVEVSGKGLEALRASGSQFPPQQKEGQHPWLLKSRGYEQEEVLRTTVRSNEKGVAVLTFTPPRDGYYRFDWSSHLAGIKTPPRPRDVVEASTTIWTATSETMRLGYYHEGGVEILLDEESVRPGATVPVMIVVPQSDRYVLVNQENEDFIGHQVVHTNGNVKLLQLTIGEEQIPNVFVTATMVSDLTVREETRELIVPPTRKFLSLSLKLDRDQYLPQQEGTVKIRALDASGKPVRAEVSLAVADESVYAIQRDYAGDPRQVFYGQKREHEVQTASSFSMKGYVEVMSKEKEAEERARDENEVKKQGLAMGVLGGVVGGVEGGAMQAESISVTASAPMVAERKDMAMPPPPAPPPPAAMAKSASPNQAPEAAVQVRNDFRSTAFWQPDVMTDEDGNATVKVRFPDSLTTWRATARAFTKSSQVGETTEYARTKQPLIVRLEAPRFLVTGDESVISAVVDNNTEKPISVRPALDVSGLDVVGLSVNGKPVKGEQGPLAVPSNGEARADWIVRARVAGRARLRVTGRSGELADAMENTIPVFEHGIDKLLAASGRVSGASSTYRIDLPKERRGTTLTVQLAPSIAGTLFDALPYLIDYPYGCTEQTMSRFLPAIVVAKTLSTLGISREAIAGRIFGGIETATADATHPKGKRNLDELDKITGSSLQRLRDFQHSDGGWGWWKDGTSDHHMTAYVVWGLSLAEDAGVTVHSEMLARGVDYLRHELVKEEDDPDRQAWMLHALGATSHGHAPVAPETKAIDNLWAKRDHLSSYGLALYAMSVQQFGQHDRAMTLARNLENGAVIDDAPGQSVLLHAGTASDSMMGTAHWGSRGNWWLWYDSPVESTALTLRALEAIDPGHRLIEPAMNWLVKNRRGAQWSNTRDTALAILALTDYLRVSGEAGASIGYDVSVNGTRVKTGRTGSDGVISAPIRIEVPATALVDGPNTIVVTKTSGSGPLYVSSEARFFSLEEPVKAAGNEMFVSRRYERLEPRTTLLKGTEYDRVPLVDGDAIRSGERVDVVVTVDLKNDYEYLLFEDLKPAGLEAVELVSGTPLYATKLKSAAVDSRYGKGAVSGKINPDRAAAVSSEIAGSEWIYRELRDRKVAMFATHLEQGVWEIRYALRAEVPGVFHALPLMGQAMYVPEIKANSDEVRITVNER